MKLNRVISKKTVFITLPIYSLFLSFLVVYAYFQVFGASTFDIMDGTLYTPSGKIIERVSGPDRYATAAGISANYYPNPTYGTVILASGENWPDALAGSVLARVVNGPVLITPSSSLNSYTFSEINRLKAKKVIIIGGTPAISDTVVNSLKSKLPQIEIERIAGADRYGTAAKVADKIYQLQGNNIPDKTVFVVTGTDFPDGLSASAIAGAKKYPILMSKTDTLPPEIAAQIKKMGITRTIIVGGEVSVSKTVESLLPGPKRVAGSNRYETSKNLITWAMAGNIPGLNLSNLGIASGENWPDALTGSAFIASKNSYLLLTPYNMTSLQSDFIKAKAGGISRIAVFGGPTSVSNSTLLTIGAKMGIDYTQKQINLQTLLDQKVKTYPIISGATVDYGETYGYQAICYYKSGKILVDPNHTVSLDVLLQHEIGHIIDWRDNGRIDWDNDLRGRY